MELEWDNSKGKVNFKKHGLSFKDAEEVLQGFTVYFEDQRKEYGESRWVAYGLLKDIVVCVVYTVRATAIRIISLRKANRRERRKYEKEIRQACTAFKTEA